MIKRNYGVNCWVIGFSSGGSIWTIQIWSYHAGKTVAFEWARYNNERQCNSARFHQDGNARKDNLRRQFGLKAIDERK
jgi:hypothetical protein